MICGRLCREPSVGGRTFELADTDGIARWHLDINYYYYQYKDDIIRRGYASYNLPPATRTPQNPLKKDPDSSNQPRLNESLNVGRRADGAGPT